MHLLFCLAGEQFLCPAAYTVMIPQILFYIFEDGVRVVYLYYNDISVFLLRYHALQCKFIFCTQSFNHYQNATHHNTAICIYIDIERAISKNPRPHHNIMKLLQANPIINPRTPIRLQNHIPQQVLAHRILLQLARNAPQMTQCNRPIRAAREEPKRGVGFGGGIVVVAGAQFGGCDGEEGGVGDVAGAGWVEGGEDGVEFAGVGGGEA